MELNVREKNGAEKVHSRHPRLSLKHSEKSSPISQLQGFAVRKNELKESRQIIMLLP